MNPNISGPVLLAAHHLESALTFLEVARNRDEEARIAIDNLVDDQKLLRIVEKLAELAEQPAEDRRIFTEGKIS